MGRQANGWGWFVAGSLLLGPGVLVMAQNNPILLDGSLSSGNLDQGYGYTLGVAGGAPPYRWAILNGNLPNGLSLNSTSGRIEGTPNTTDTTTFTVQVQDSAGLTASRTYTLNITGRGFQVVAEPATLTVTQGQTASVRLRVTGETPTTNGTIGFNLVSALPEGTSGGFEPPLLASGATEATFTIASTRSAVVGTYPLRIAAVSGAYSQQVNFSVRVLPPAPVISSFSPAGGPVGTTVNLRGSGLLNASGVTFGGLRAIFNPISDTELTAVVPAGARPGRIVVTTANGAATSDRDFAVPTFTLAATPNLVTLRPGGSAVYTLSYTGEPTALITLDATVPEGLTAEFEPNYLDSRNPRARLKLQADPGLAPGNYLFTVVSGLVRLNVAARVLAPAPVLTRLSPVRGTAGTLITLNGRNFQTGARLTLGELDLTVTQLSGSQIQAVLPGTAQSNRLRLINPDGQSATTSTVLVVSEPVPAVR